MGSFRRLILVAGTSALICQLVAGQSVAAASTQTLNRARLIALPICPSTDRPPADTDEFFGALLGILAPKIVGGISNFFTGLIRGAAEKADREKTASATAAAGFDFYQYDAADAELHLNPAAGCIVFVQGEFGEKKGAKFDVAPVSVLPNGDAPSVYEIRAPKEGEKGYDENKQIQKLGWFRKKFGEAEITTWPEYFKWLGLADSPNLYMEFAVEEAFKDLGETYLSKTHFQLQPAAVWYRGAIGSKGGDKKPSLLVEVEFKRTQSAEAFAADPIITDGDSAPAAIALRDLPIGTVLGPQALKGLKTAPMANFKIPEADDETISIAEKRYLELAERADEEREKVFGKKRELESTELQTLRENRKYFYLKALDYEKDPLLYIGQYVELPYADACDPLPSNKPNPDSGCNAWSRETAKAEAMETAMTEINARDACIRTAGEDEGEREACEKAMELAQHQWEVKRREAMEILNKFEAEDSARANRRQQQGANQIASVPESVGSTVVEMTVVETRELGALYAAVLEAGENFEAFTESDRAALTSAIFPTREEKTTKARNELNNLYQYQNKMLLVQNAQEDYDAALDAVEVAEAKLRTARAGGDEEKISAAQSDLREEASALRESRAALLSAKGDANVAALAAGKPLPFPGIGGPE